MKLQVKLWIVAEADSARAKSRSVVEEEDRRGYALFLSAGG